MTRVHWSMFFLWIVLEISASNQHFWLSYQVVSAEEPSPFSYSELDRLIRKKERQVEKLRVIVDQVTKYEQDNYMIKSKLNVIDNLKKNQKRPVHFLNELLLCIPPKVCLNKIHSNKNVTTISGYSISKTAINNFAENLESSFLFKEIQLSMRSISQEKIFEFDLRFSDQDYQISDYPNCYFRSREKTDPFISVTGQ
jgi:hypothetical protein